MRQEDNQPKKREKVRQKTRNEPSTKEGAKKPRIAPAVDHALTILELIATTKHRQGWTISELHRETGLAKSSIKYLLDTLVARNYLHYYPERMRYALGTRILSIGGQVMHERQLRDVARKYLENIVSRTGLGANLGILDHTDAVYIERIDPAPESSLLQVAIWIGRRMAPQITAIGKALICHLDKPSIEEIMRHNSHVRRASVKTITSLPELFKELEITRERGFAIDDGEHDPNVRCVAAPVYDAGGRVVAAMSVNGTLVQLNDDELKRIANIVREEAQHFTEYLSSGQS